MKPFVTCVVTILVALAVHVDWHLGRPGDAHHLSFNSPFHWLLALPIVFGMRAFARNRATAALPADRIVLWLAIAGVFIGHVLELAWESADVGHLSRALNPLRWRLLAEFLVAGVVFFFLLRAFDARRKTSLASGSTA